MSILRPMPAHWNQQTYFNLPRRFGRRCPALMQRLGLEQLATIGNCL